MEKLSYDELKKKVTETLDNVINDLFYEFQKENGIEYGDITPYEAFAMDDYFQKLVDEIVSVMKHQHENNLKED